MMSMDKLIAEVTECVEREYGRAGARYGLTNHSDHESFAVILEEVQETNDEYENFDRELNGFWSLVKSDGDDLSKYSRLLAMHRYALFAACEMIQVAAMAKKAAITVCDRGAIREFKERGESV
jgi:hypothetical protein